MAYGGLQRLYFSGEGLHGRVRGTLLPWLLGSARAWADAQLALDSGDSDWMFQLVDRPGKVWANRIHLVLANHADLPLVRRLAVLLGTGLDGSPT